MWLSCDNNNVGLLKRAGVFIKVGTSVVSVTVRHLLNVGSLICSLVFMDINESVSRSLAKFMYHEKLVSTQFFQDKWTLCHVFSQS